MNALRAVVRLLGALVTLALAAGCAGRPVPPLPPYIERSPLRSPQTQTYLPLLVAPHVKMGTAGCVPNCRALGCRWCYDWSLSPGLIPGVETVGMVWGASETSAPLNASSGWIMGFNEPDLAGQANLTPQQAVAPWAQVEARFRAFRLVCPAPSHLHPEWLGQFYEAFRSAMGRYPDCDAFANHCYRNNAQGCIDDVTRLIAEAQRRGVAEVWVTEFWFSQEIQARKFTDWLEREPRVTRWSPFAGRIDCATAKRDGWWNCEREGDPSLTDAAGNLTRQGAWYARPTAEPW